MNEDREELTITEKLKSLFGAYLVARTVIDKDSYSKEDIGKLANVCDECEKLTKGESKRKIVHRRSAISRLRFVLEEVDAWDSYPLFPDNLVEFTEGSPSRSLRATLGQLIDALIEVASKEEFKETRRELRKLIHDGEQLKPFRQKIEGLFGEKFCTKFSKTITWSPFFEDNDWCVRMNGQLLRESDKEWFKKKLTGHFEIYFEEDDKHSKHYRLVIKNIGDYLPHDVGKLEDKRTYEKLENKRASPTSSLSSFFASAGIFGNGTALRTINDLPDDRADPENPKIMSIVTNPSGCSIS